MTEEKFDALWQRAEAESHAERLAAGYPAWRQRQRRMTGIAAAVLVAAAVATPLLSPSAENEFEHVYCNRTGTADAQWAAVAADLLAESMAI